MSLHFFLNLILKNFQIWICFFKLKQKVVWRRDGCKIILNRTFQHVLLFCSMLYLLNSNPRTSFWCQIDNSIAPMNLGKIHNIKKFNHLILTILFLRVLQGFPLTHFFAELFLFKIETTDFVQNFLIDLDLVNFVITFLS